MRSNALFFFGYRLLNLSFALGFIVGPINGILNPENTIVRHNGEVVETNLENLLPFIIIGTIALLIYLWTAFNYFRAMVNHEGITINYWFKKELIPWHEIEQLEPQSLPKRGVNYKLKARGKRRIFFRTDRWYSGSRFLSTSSEEPTEMEQFLDWKKKEMGIR